MNYGIGGAITGHLDTTGVTRTSTTSYSPKLGGDRFAKNMYLVINKIVMKLNFYIDLSHSCYT